MYVKFPVEKKKQTKHNISGLSKLIRKIPYSLSQKEAALL